MITMNPDHNRPWRGRADKRIVPRAAAVLAAVGPRRSSVSKPVRFEAITPGALEEISG